MKTAGQKPTPKPPSAVGINGRTTKKRGGSTGKGFLPGKSGNPSGRSPRVADFGKEVREFLREWHPKSRDKTRLLVLLETLAENDPKVLLHYGFGKPIEMTVANNKDGNGPKPKQNDLGKLNVSELLELKRLLAIANGDTPPGQYNAAAR
jgi:hypothetical protein